jgi:hypothetical protein
MAFGRDVLVNVIGSVIATLIVLYVMKTYMPGVAANVA